MRVKPAKRPPERVEPFTIADMAVAPGATARVELKLARLPAGAALPMSVMVVHGARPGPTAWVSAAIHGDELNGVVTVRRLLAELDPTNLRGTVLAVPVVNVFGVTIGSRYLPDRRDLNRSFPGSRRGSLAGRIAYLFFEAVVSRCSVGIDCHAGSGGRSNLPQLRCNMDDAETARLATAFGAPLVLHSPLRQDSLRAAAGKLGVRVLLYEAGEAGRLDEDCIDTGVCGILRTFKALGMLDRAPKPKRPTVKARTSNWLRAPRSGFWLPSIAEGARVERGTLLGTIYDAIHESDRQVLARETGLVIGLLRSALVHQGDAILHIAGLDT